MHFDAAYKKIQKIAQTAGIFSKNDVGTGINLKGAAIRRLKLRVAVRAGEDNLLGLDQIADIQRDQKGTEQAMSALQEVVTRFPNTPYANVPLESVTLADVLATPAAARNLRPPALATSGLTKTYGDLVALEQRRKALLERASGAL